MGLPGLSDVRERVDSAARRAGRDPEEITLVAVTKYASDRQVRAAYEAGARDLGESRAGDLERRAELLPPDVRWHFVGRLQSNKARKVRPVVHLLHSLDRMSLVEAWVKGPAEPPAALVQVDLADEPQKGGVAVDDVDALVESALEMGIEVRGLMTIPPLGDEARQWFAELRRLRDRLVERHPSATALSMGMSANFEVAISEGATLLRVGRAIFARGEPPS